MNRFILLIPLIFFCSSIDVCAQINLEKDSIIHKGKKRKVFAFPAMIYSPETTLAFGGAGNYYFKLGHDSTTRTSYVQALGLYTLRHQAVLAMESVIFFHNEKYLLKTKASTSYFPDRFWGLGNNSGNDFERYTIGQFYLYPQLLRRTYKKLFLGAAFEMQNVFSFEYGKGLPSGQSLFDQQNVNGRSGSFISGLGLVALWDGRDNAFSPTKGLYFSYSVNDFSDLLGSRYNFTSQAVDIRKYFPLSKNHVLAFQFVLHANNGTVPVRSMANIGSNTIMRGYYEGRFTDKNLIAFQVEHRIHLINRLGMVLFGAAGRVGSKAEDVFTFNGLKPAVGTGIRYAIDKKEKLNFRFDVGFGQRSNGFYFYITEAF
ncbi:MAG: BamA/TamA family outer membrane protein [Bacteroidetes bacterium]|nr:BamA/TamA family outer membrane protein [Bacteroidota bacterium]